MAEAKNTQTRAERTAALRKRATAASIGLLAGAFAMVAISTQQTGQAATVAAPTTQGETAQALSQATAVSTAQTSPATAAQPASAVQAAVAGQSSATDQTATTQAATSLTAAATQTATQLPAAQSGGTSKTTTSHATTKQS